jgi:hypothetical protein
MANASPPSPRRLRWLRLRFSLLWLLFFLMVALVLILTLLSWRRSPPSAPVALAPRSSALAPRSSAIAHAERFFNRDQGLVKITFGVYRPMT